MKTAGLREGLNRTCTGRNVMKQLIVTAALIMLGLAIFGMIAGSDDSLYSTVRSVWEKQAEHRLLTDDPPR